MSDLPPHDAGWRRRVLVTVLIATLLSSVCAVTGTARASSDAPSAVGPLMKLLDSGRLPPERVPTVVEMICKRGNEHDLRVVLDRVLREDTFDAELQLQVLGWLADAAETRKVRPAGDLSGISALIAGDDAQRNAQRQRAAIHLAAGWKEASVAPALQSLALDPDAPEDLRDVAIDSLVIFGDAQSVHVLQQLAGEEFPLAIRMRAAAGLAAHDLSAAADAAAHALASTTPEQDAGKLLDAFFHRQHGPDALAAALEHVTLNPDVAKHALRYMYSVGRSDQKLSDVLSAAAGLEADMSPPTPAEVAQIVADVSSHGDAARGETIFRRKDLNCMKCHSLRGAGGQIGPDLSAVGASSPVDYIVNSILNPNLAVKEQFATRVFFLDDGRAVTGVVIDRDEVQVNVRDAHGDVLAIPVADIEEEAEGQSLMPQGLTRFLTRDELLDLARFVSELGKPGPYAVQTSKTIQRWRLLRSPAAELVDDVPHLEHIRQFVLGTEPQQWESAYAKVSGELPLAELRSAAGSDDGNGPAVLILQGELDVTAAGAVGLHVECTEPFLVWLDDDPLRLESSSQAILAPGQHTVTLRVECSEREDASLRVELVAPEGSDANFTVVGGS